MLTQSENQQFGLSFVEHNVQYLTWPLNSAILFGAIQIIQKSEQQKQMFMNRNNHAYMHINTHTYWKYMMCKF